MSYSDENHSYLSISPKPGADKNAWQLDLLCESNKSLSLVVSAAGEIILSRSLRAKTGWNHFPIHLKSFAEGEFEFSLLDTDSVISAKVKV